MIYLCASYILLSSSVLLLSLWIIYVRSILSPRWYEGGGGLELLRYTPENNIFFLASYSWCFPFSCHCVSLSRCGSESRPYSIYIVWLLTLHSSCPSALDIGMKYIDYHYRYTYTLTHILYILLLEQIFPPLYYFVSEECSCILLISFFSLTYTWSLVCR